MTVVFLRSAAKQVSKLDKSVQKRIKTFVSELERLENPFSRGKGLVGNHLGFWRYRVGDYRLICKIKKQVMTISVVEVGHRSKVYD